MARHKVILQVINCFIFTPQSLHSIRAKSPLNYHLLSLYVDASNIADSQVKDDFTVAPRHAASTFDFDNCMCIVKVTDIRVSLSLTYVRDLDLDTDIVHVVTFCGGFF